MPHEPGSLSAVCEWADALHLELVEATLRLEGGTAGRGGAEAFALAIREFHAAAARVAEVPAATPAELAMKAQVTR